MTFSEPARTEHHHRGTGAGGRPLTVGPVGADEHLAFVRARRSVSFLQTPAWGRVKTE